MCVYPSWYSVQQRERLVNILLLKDGSAILKALEMLDTRECGYKKLVKTLFDHMDVLQTLKDNKTTSKLL